MSLRDRIFGEVLRAGFDRVGCLPLSESGDAGFEAWLASGYHGEMGWMARHAPAKTDPPAAFSQFRTVVVAMLEYGSVSPAPTDPRTGNISRYALGEDYHRVLKRRLHAAADRVREDVPGVATRAFVDTGPLNEKIIAARAGLGWQGKHTNLIDPSRGSYFFLGLLLVDAELPATGPQEPDRCGLCDACIPACPTGAIVAPYVLDAQRCISYLTIELRGPIPRKLRPLVGNRIFGCDDCQEVCPWNRFARDVPPEPFHPRPGMRDVDLDRWLRLSLEEWRATFRHSPVKRPGYVGFLRNALVAAGCSRDPELVPAVAPFLTRDHEVLRSHGAWALGEIGGATARQTLERALPAETSPLVREEIDFAIRALGVFRGSQTKKNQDR